jgi:hypothetical protein
MLARSRAFGSTLAWMNDSPTAVEHARALHAEYTRQQIAFINVEFTTALTFLDRAATETEAGHLDRVAVTAHQAQIAYDEAVKHLAAGGLSGAEQEPLELRRRDVANRLARFSK